MNPRATPAKNAGVGRASIEARWRAKTVASDQPWLGTEVPSSCGDRGAGRATARRPPGRRCGGRTAAPGRRRASRSPSWPRCPSRARRGRTPRTPYRALRANSSCRSVESPEVAVGHFATQDAIGADQHQAFVVGAYRRIHPGQLGNDADKREGDPRDAATPLSGNTGARGAADQRHDSRLMRS